MEYEQDMVPFKAFEFKYVKQEEFDNVAKRVKTDRCSKDGYVWNSFCTRSPAAATAAPPITQVSKEDVEKSKMDSDFFLGPLRNGTKIRILTDNEIKGIVDTAVNEVTAYNPKAKAPFLGSGKSKDAQYFKDQEAKEARKAARDAREEAFEMAERKKLESLSKSSESNLQPQFDKKPVQKSFQKPILQPVKKSSPVGATKVQVMKLQMSDDSISIHSCDEKLMNEMMSEFNINEEDFDNYRSSSDVEPVEYEDCRTALAMSAKEEEYLREMSRKLKSGLSKNTTNTKSQFKQVQELSFESEDEDNIVNVWHATSASQNQSVALFDQVEEKPEVFSQKTVNRSINRSSQDLQKVKSKISENRLKTRPSAPVETSRKQGVVTSTSKTNPKIVVKIPLAEPIRQSKQARSQAATESSLLEDEQDLQSFLDEILTKQQKPNRRPKREDPKDQPEVMLTLSKITNIHNKVCQCLDMIKEDITEAPQIEDEIDLYKRQKRAAEFTNRFARNNLYQIGRLTEEIRTMTGTKLELATKVLAMFQIMMQACQTYLRNVEYFMVNQCPDKLDVLIDFIVNSTKICIDKKVFDKKDLLIQEMLQHCSDITIILEVNRDNSPIVLGAKPRVQKMKPAYENPYSFDPYRKNNFAMYGAPVPKKTQKPKIIKESATKKLSCQSSRSNLAKNRPATPLASKTSIGQISTMMEQIKNDELKSEAEKPLEVKSSAPDMSMFMEAFQNMAQDKINEILGPLLSNMMKNNMPTVQSNSCESSEPVSRVTSERSVKKKISKAASDKSLISKKSVISEDLATPKDKNVSKLAENLIPKKSKKQVEEEEARKKYEIMKKECIDARNAYKKGCEENPLYYNDTFEQPWVLFANISDALVEEMVKELGSTFDFGEKTFVEEVLQHEMAC